MLEDIGCDLLVDESGKFRGDDIALFVSCPRSDGDSKGACHIVKAQQGIVGAAADGKSEGTPCVTHVGKNSTSIFTSCGKTIRRSGELEALRTPGFRLLGGM
jgi:hypothetical protein